MWLALPLVAWTLPFVRRLTLGVSARDVLDIRFERWELEPLWLAVSLVGALALAGFAAARRKGRALWAACDVLVGALPWVVSLAAQSVTGQAGVRAHAFAAGQAGWAGGDPSDRAVAMLTMHETRGLGALMSACLWGAAAVVWLLPSAERPHWRGAGLVVVTLPLWGIAYGFPSAVGVLPWLAAAFLSLLVAYMGTQRSLAARQAARSALVLATLTVLALWVATLCTMLTETPVIWRTHYIDHHGALLAALSAARLGALVTLLPAVLAARWLTRPGDPKPAVGAWVALAFAFVGMMALDRVGTRLALARVAPDPWPPWAGVEVHPLVLSHAADPGRDASRGPRRTRFILATGVLRDAQGVTLAQLDDPPSVVRALTSVVQARRDGALPRSPTVSAPDAPSRAPVSPDGAGPTVLGERLAIVAMPVAPPRPICPGGLVSVLVDRGVSMSDMRTFLSAATAAGVSEIEVAGPRALTERDKLALADALNASGQEGAFPLGTGDEGLFVDATLALPPLGIPALDALSFELGAVTVLTPSACWRAQLLDEAPMEATDESGSAADEDAALPLGERLEEQMFVDDAIAIPSRTVLLWLDPARDVASVLLETSGPENQDATVMWVLEPPAP